MDVKSVSEMPAVQIKRCPKRTSLAIRRIARIRSIPLRRLSPECLTDTAAAGSCPPTQHPQGCISRSPARHCLRCRRARFRSLKMKYATIRYEKSGYECLLDLHSFDGTCRRVAFSSDQEMTSALMSGRAEADCTAVEYGMLPRGATLVSSASAADPHQLLARMKGQTTDDINPLAAVRLSFSQKILSDRSESITEARDAKTRQDRPEDARRYELLVDAIERASENGGLF